MMRERQACAQFLSFVPELKFARLVAGVGADLEHRDHDDLDRNGLGRHSAA